MISFNNVHPLNFLEGLRFDISALVYINIPLFLLILIPHNFRTNKHYKRCANIIFYGLNIPFIMLNNVDIEYFKFTQKRSTTDFFDLLQLGKDAQNIIPQYILDYWPITLLTLIQVWLLLKIKKLPNFRITAKLIPILLSLLMFVLGSSFVILGARGGTQLKPINAINAGELFGSENSSLILNTPFCILHSYDKQQLIVHNYLNEQELKNTYSPIHHNKQAITEKYNIIILIMESYSKEFVGGYNQGEGYTPFLDSLMQFSLVFDRAFANGLKSIEALPAITASIPTLMNNPFITSTYAQNKFESLATLLNNEQYSTSFFHGGLRGTMGFYSYSRKAGFNRYYGMEEYNNDADFDGSWGIYDAPFFRFFNAKLNTEQQPFFSTFFSLSSHPPYRLPNHYVQEDNKDVGIRETIKYTDYAMRTFFDEAQKQEWFKNTIFVITADHTSGVNFFRKYKNKIGRYSIPLIIFKGDSSLQGINNNIVQQIDIMPTILEIIGYNKPYLAFGKSMLGSEQWAISKLYNQYRLITPNGILTNKSEEYTAFQDWNFTKKTAVKEKDILLLKAIKQDYNYRMITNNIADED